MTHRMRALPALTPMHRGRLPACSCRSHQVDGLHRPSGRTASRNTPSPIMSPTRSQPGSRIEIRLNVRAHSTHHTPKYTPHQADGALTAKTSKITGDLLSEVAQAHDARLERTLSERGALLMLWQVPDAERVEERAHVGLDGLDTEDQFVGDLAV
jgi:hypothetical protein